MSIKLTILGCHSATPREAAHPTAQFLEINHRFFLIDCGEGTQMQLRKSKIKFSSINHIFISHLHGDHFFGLIGLVSTFGLLGRKNDLHIFGPTGLMEIIQLQLKATSSYLGFNLIFHELNSKEEELIFEDDHVEIHTIPLNHRVYTNGFLFKEKVGERKLNISAIKENPEIEICDYQHLKNGRDFVLQDGTVIKNKHLTFNPNAPLSYAYCSDTSYKPAIVRQIKNVDLLYHESTFLKDKVDLAVITKHSTAEEAAKIAKAANVGQLILGHYSSRYPEKKLFLEEAKTIFDQVILSEDGKVISLENSISNALCVAHQN
ncbi:ribonuclease Z [Flavobacteriaceae bacterium F08102]|nr:ribonuclease Z [Flavobacteriaceae bacterium F08102]